MIVYPFVCPYVITSNSFPYSDSKSKLTQPPPVNLSHTTSPTVSNVPHPCLPCPPVNWSPFPVNWSHNEQDHITDLSFSIWGRVMRQLDIFSLIHEIVFLFSTSNGWLVRPGSSMMEPFSACVIKYFYSPSFPLCRLTFKVNN